MFDRSGRYGEGRSVVYGRLMDGTVVPVRVVNCIVEPVEEHLIAGWSDPDVLIEVPGLA